MLRQSILARCRVRRWQLYPGLALALPGTVLLLSLLGHSPSTGGVVHAADLLPVRVEPLSLVIDELCDTDSSTSLSTEMMLSNPRARTLVTSSPLRYESDLQTGRGALLRLDMDALTELRARDRVVLEGFILEPGRIVDLNLQRMRVFDDRTEFIVGTVSGDVPVAPPDVVLLRGTVAGVPGSDVFLGLSAGAINGSVHIGEDTYILSSGPRSSGLAASAGLCAITRLDALGEYMTGEIWECRTDGGLVAPALRGSLATGRASAGAGLRVCRLAIECDYEYYTMMNSDSTAAFTYIAQLLAAASAIYERDFGVTLVLSYVRIWTTFEDPYNKCAFDGLREFADYAEVYLRDKDYHIGLRLSGCGGGARAYIDMLCEADEARGFKPYAIGRVQGFFPFPLAPHADNWDVYMVSHELGHTFGSRHTHCYDPPIDSCFSGDRSCFTGDVFCEQGTIMSYCDHCQGGLRNVDFRFHKRVKELVRSRVEESCLEALGNGFYVYNDGPEVLVIDSIATPGAWLTVTPRAFSIAPGGSTLVSVFPIWESIPHYDQMEWVVIHPSDDADRIAAAVEVTTNRRRPFATFSASVTEGCWPLTVEFTNESTNDPTEWRWWLGDGHQRDIRDVSHTYWAAGKYLVRLTATNACGTHRSPSTFYIEVREPDLCCELETVIIPKNDRRDQLYDLWECARAPDVAFDTIRYEIVENTFPECGARIEENRFFSVVPDRGWFGESHVTIRASIPNGCYCETTVLVVVNDPPEIEIVSPSAGVHITNQFFTLGWIDSDGDQNARIQFYRSPNRDCTNGVIAYPLELFEDAEGDLDQLSWSVEDVPDGLYYIRAVISDLYVSAEACSPGQVLVDRTPPVTQVTFTCLNGDANGWCDGQLQIDLEAADNLTGVSGIFYSLNNARAQRYTEPVVVTIEGETAFKYYAVDVAGNKEEIRITEPIKVDTQAPIIIDVTSENALFQPGDATSLLPKFTVQFLDRGVGIDERTALFKITPGASDGPVVFTSDSAGFSFNPVTRRMTVTTSTPLLTGPHTFDVSIADILGNVSRKAVKFHVSGSLTLTDVLNYPNPIVENETYFTFMLSQEADVSIRIYDLSGTVMRHLGGISGRAGYNEVRWDGLSAEGLTLANGAYLYEISSTNSSGTVRRLEKMAILR